VHDTWKATLRLQAGAATMGLPVFLPEDTAIPAKEVPAEQSFTRPFTEDKKNLQREQKAGTAGALKAVAYSAVALIAFALLGALGWGLGRIGGTDRKGQSRPPRAERSSAAARPPRQPASVT
jgi:hypothetical protein